MDDDELADFVTMNEVVYNDDSLGPKPPRGCWGWIVAIVTLLAMTLAYCLI